MSGMTLGTRRGRGKRVVLINFRMCQIDCVLGDIPQLAGIAIQVTLVNKSLASADKMNVVLKINNSSQRSITAMTMQLKLVKNNRFLMNLNMDMKIMLDAGGNLRLSGQEAFDANHPGHQMLLSANTQDVVVFVNLKKVTFSDGSSLGY